MVTPPLFSQEHLRKRKPVDLNISPSQRCKVGLLASEFTKAEYFMYPWCALNED